MKKRKYIYTNKKHSQRAIMAVILGIISLTSMGIVIYLTYRSGGEAANGYGVTGVFATLFSFVGLILGILTVRERNYFPLWPWLGLLLNLFSLGSISFILYLGNLL